MTSPFQRPTPSAITIPEAAARIAARVGDQVVVGPSVWQPSDGVSAKSWYFIIAGQGADGFVCAKMEGRAEERAGFIASLMQRRPLVIHDMGDELDMARLCESLWPCEKTRRIKAAIEAERTEVTA